MQECSENPVESAEMELISPLGIAFPLSQVASGPVPELEEEPKPPAPGRSLPTYCTYLGTGPVA